MYEMASDLLIVQDGTLPEVRMHGEWPAPALLASVLLLALTLCTCGAEQWQSGFGNPEAGLPRSAFDARQGSSSLAEGERPSPC